MHTTNEMLDLIAERHGNASDYRLAKLLQVNRSAVSNYRRGVSHFGNAVAFRVADLLNLDPAYVIACVSAEQSKTDQERQVWERIARAVAATVAGIALIGGGLGVSPTAHALHNVCILCKKRSRAWIGHTTDLPLAA